MASLKMNQPTNLLEAIEILENILDKELISEIKRISENEMIRFHSGLGRQLRNEWGLWKADTELFKYFKDLGIWHADDMSGIILTSLYRKLNNNFIFLDEQIEYYQQYWENHKGEK